MTRTAAGWARTYAATALAGPYGNGMTPPIPTPIAIPPNSSPMQSRESDVRGGPLRPGWFASSRVAPSGASFITQRYSPLGEPGDLHGHVQVGGALPGVDAFQRGNVGVVAARPHADVLLGDLGVVGGVIAPPRARPGLDPGVTSPVHGVPDGGVRFGMQVARHVVRGNPHAAQQHQRQMHEVLADALALFERVQTGRVHAGGSRKVVQLVAHPIGRGDNGFGRPVGFAELL